MRLAWDNKGDLAVVTAGSQIGTLPGSNVQNVHLSKKWHTAAGVKSSHLLFDFGKQVSFSQLAVLGANLSEMGHLRLRASPSSSGVSSDVTLDTGFVDASRRKVLRLPRKDGNYASTPGTNPAIHAHTVDIDIRIKVWMDDWTPPDTAYLITKHASTGDQRSWAFYLTAAGQLGWLWNPNGTAGGNNTVNSDPVGFADASKHWVRVTFDVDDGAGNRVTKFWKSEDYDPETEAGTWTQIGATSTVAGVASLFKSTAPVEIGTLDSGGAQVRWSGRVYYAEVRRGIDGPRILRFDPDKDGTVGGTSFASSATRETWTINQSGSPKAEILIPTHASLKSGYGALYKAVGRSYLRIPGLGGNYAATPDSAANSLAGSIEIRMKVTMDDWTPVEGDSYFFAKHLGTGDHRSFIFFISSGGLLTWLWNPNGTAGGNNFELATVATGFADGSTHWLRVSFDANSGGNHVTKFYTSEDYDPATQTGTWTQLGGTVTVAGVATVFNSNAALEIGTIDNGGGARWSGKVHYAELQDGVGLTDKVVASFDPSRAAASGATSVASERGETWTINVNQSPSAAIVKDEAGTARYARLDLTDYSVADNLQVGRVFIGPSWEHDQTLVYGWGATPLDESELEESYGGQSYADAKAKRRVLDFKLDYLTEAEVYENPFAMARAAGVVKDVLAIPHEDGAYVSEQAVWGLVTASKPVVRRGPQLFSQQFTVRERL